MKCPECGYNIPDGMRKCLCCGYTVTALRVLSEEEIRRSRQNDRIDDDTSGHKTIDPDDVFFGQQQQGYGGIFDQFFSGSPFGGSAGGGIFGSFGSIIGDLFGGLFGGQIADEDYYEDEDEEENYTYDALGDRVPKPPVKTMIVTEVEEYDENGELRSKKGKKNKDKRKNGK